MNIFDLMAILPFYLQLFLQNSSTQALRVLRMVRLVRLFRIFKLGRYSSGMRLVAQALLNSFQALWVLVFFLWIGIFLFSSCLYYAEKMSCPSNPGWADFTEEQRREYAKECEPLYAVR